MNVTAFIYVYFGYHYGEKFIYRAFQKKEYRFQTYLIFQGLGLVQVAANEVGEKQLTEREKKKEKKSVSMLDQYQVWYESTA